VRIYCLTISLIFGLIIKCYVFVSTGTSQAVTKRGIRRSHTNNIRLISSTPSTISITVDYKGYLLTHPPLVKPFTTMKKVEGTTLKIITTTVNPSTSQSSSKIRVPSVTLRSLFKTTTALSLQHSKRNVKYTTSSSDFREGEEKNVGRKRFENNDSESWQVFLIKHYNFKKWSKKMYKFWYKLYH